MDFKVTIFSAIVMIIVGIYDMSYAYNRRNQPTNKGGIKAFSILGIIFTVAGIILLIMKLVHAI